MLLQPFLSKEKTHCDIIPLIERNKKRLRSGKMYKSNSSIFSNYNIWLNAVKNDKKTFNELKSIGVERGLKRSRRFKSCFSKNRSKSAPEFKYSAKCVKH